MKRILIIFTLLFTMQAKADDGFGFMATFGNGNNQFSDYSHTFGMNYIFSGDKYRVYTEASYDDEMVYTFGAETKLLSTDSWYMTGSVSKNTEKEFRAVVNFNMNYGL